MSVLVFIRFFLTFFVALACVAVNADEQEYLKSMYLGVHAGLSPRCSSIRAVSLNGQRHARPLDIDEIPYDSMFYFCAGLIIRGVRQDFPENLNAWDPYPDGRTSDVSFSFIMWGINMKRLAWSYSNGFIIDPPTDLKVNCFYPLDGDSDRRLDKGCGPHEIKPKMNPECPENVILNDTVPFASRCRYDLRGHDPVGNFHKGVIAAIEASGDSEFPNDLKIEVWNKGCDSRLPIRAFFYVNEQGKPFATRDRNKYKEMCGPDLPLVHLQFPVVDYGPIIFDVIE